MIRKRSRGHDQIEAHDQLSSAGLRTFILKLISSLCPTWLACALAGTLRVQSTSIQCLYGFHIRNRNCGLDTSCFCTWTLKGSTSTHHRTSAIVPSTLPHSHSCDLVGFRENACSRRCQQPPTKLLRYLQP